MAMTEFTPWPKTARYFRDIVVTEKLDGTNAAIHIDEAGVVQAQSRKRLITPEADNFGFARWVTENRETLMHDLGPGTHFGEWWGLGIQRGYGMKVKTFSLFNTRKWTHELVMDFKTPNLTAVPVLYEGEYRQQVIHGALTDLKMYGSLATPHHYGNPEGVCIFHTAANVVFKATIENDWAPKSLLNI